MRLIDKLIKSKRVHVASWAMDHLRDLGTILYEKAVCVDVQNVAEWFFEGHTGPVRYERLSPMCAMPFDHMWFEYLHKWNSRYNEPLTLQVGMLISRADPRSQYYAVVCFWLDHPDHGVGMQEARAMLFRNGEALQKITFDESMNGRTAYGKELGSVLSPAVAAISFFHCANVRIHTEYPSHAHAKAFERKHGIKPRSVKVIDIHKPSDRYESAGAGDTGRSAVASHFVRGHFKRYNNLFGSISGVWFWRPHVRGEESEAQLPNYRVHPPTKEHHGKCIVQP